MLDVCKAVFTAESRFGGLLIRRSSLSWGDLPLVAARVMVRGRRNIGAWVRVSTVARCCSLQGVLQHVNSWRGKVGWYADALVKA